MNPVIDGVVGRVVLGPTSVPDKGVMGSRMNMTGAREKKKNTLPSTTMPNISTFMATFI
jgi:hypothetical protein